MKNFIDVEIDLDELDISYNSIPEQRQTLEQEGIPAHIEINFIKFRGVDISDLIGDDVILDYLETKSEF
jgi:hypothetical protein